MAEIVMKDYLAMLEKSRLFESRAILDECLEKWGALDETAPENAPRVFAEWLIANHFITQWQSDNIFAGKYKGFFLGKYKLLRSIGAGGMSSVYLAVHTLLERQVAIKVLPKSRVTSDSSYLERFLLEAQAVAALDHPNIVRAYDVDTEGNSIYYLVMEYIDGPDLLSYVKKEGPLDIYRAAKYVRQAATGLHHAHLAGLIHRDMKPANLLVDSEDNVHVLDLGLARFTDEKRASLTLTYDENVLGTADYLAPEQARNSHTVDARADIYGLGCTLYYLLVGHVPFPDGTLAQRIAAHQKRMPAPIRDERPEVPEDLVAICWKMMAKDPNDRQQTAEEVAEDLTCWLLENGQNVEGFTGSLSSLQKKRQASENQRMDALQADAQKELESFSEFASLANLGGNGKKSAISAKSPAEASRTAPVSKKSGDELKQRIFSVIGKVNTFFDSSKKGKRGANESGKPQSVVESPQTSSGSGITKTAPEAFSFGDNSKVENSATPYALDFSAQELKKSENSDSQTEISLHVELPTKEKERKTESVGSSVLKEKTRKTNESNVGIPKQGSSIASRSTVFSASSAMRGSSIRKKNSTEEPGLMDFLTQKSPNTESDSTIRAFSESQNALNFGGEMASKSGSSLKSSATSIKPGSTIRHSAVNGSGVSKNQKKTDASAIRPSRSSLKQNEKMLYACVALGFFIILILLALVAF